MTMGGKTALFSSSVAIIWLWNPTWMASVPIGGELSSPYCRILMSPDLSEAMPIPLGLNPFPSASSSARPASLGLLIQHLKECLEGYSNSLESHQQKTNKLKAGGRSLSVEDIKTVRTAGRSLNWIVHNTWPQWMWHQITSMYSPVYSESVI